MWGPVADTGSATDQGQLKLADSLREQAVWNGMLMLGAVWQSSRLKIAGIHRVKSMNKLLGLPTLLVAITVNAGEADVAAVDVTRSTDGTYSFDVTVQHADDGWKHYANRWEVVAPDGDVLGTRTLYHPHVDEQPFTRSLTGVVIPPNVTTVTVRAHDLVHGDGGTEMVVDIPK